VLFTKISPVFEVGVKGQKSRSPGPKSERVRYYFESGPWGHELCHPPGLRWWKNQRMLSSLYYSLKLRHFVR